MKTYPRRTTLIVVLVLISAGCLVSYFNYTQKQEMYEKFSSRLPHVFLDLNNPTFWKMSIKVSEQEIQKMESPTYKQDEQEKMNGMGFDITITDEMISEEYKQKKKELDFARKELERLTGGSNKKGS